jgi:non-ribosomal peptide synthetase component E (peptide arylation enzyme)
LGYLEDPERTAASFTDDGWFKTGDKAIVDDDGYVTIKGRIKDIIIRGGENIPVREIEEYLHEHPKVADGAIVAMPDERLQERGCAYVIPTDPDDPLTFEEMVEYLKSQGIPETPRAARSRRRAPDDREREGPAVQAPRGHRRQTGRRSGRSVASRER